jgi:Protein of unknown function (DUF2442)
MPDAKAAPRRRPAPALATAKRRAVPPQSDPHRYIGLNRSLKDDRHRLAALAQVVEQNAKLITRALHEPSPKSVRFDDNSIWAELADGRGIAVPMAWFPRIMQATPEQRAQLKLSPRGLHWEALGKPFHGAGNFSR